VNPYVRDAAYTGWLRKQGNAHLIALSREGEKHKIWSRRLFAIYGSELIYFKDPHVIPLSFLCSRVLGACSKRSNFSQERRVED
jgi:hypothetical protein